MGNITDGLEPYVVFHHVMDFFFQRVYQELPESIHFIFGLAPIFCAESIQGQILDTHFSASLCNICDRLDCIAVATESWSALLLSLPAIVIHTTSKMTAYTG